MMSQMDLGPDYRPKTSRQREVDDFRRVLPGRVLPTTARILGTEGHILVVRHYGHKEEPTKAQDQLYRSLVALGNHEDAPGSVSVMCLWGVAGLPVDRAMQLYDHMGVGPRKPATDDEIGSAIRHWWLNHGGRS